MTDPAASSLLPLVVAIPLAAGAVCPLAARLWRRLPLIIALAALLASGVLLLTMAPRIYAGHVLVQFMGHVTPVHGAALGIAFAADPFGMTFALITAFLGSLLVLSTLSELGVLGPRELGGYSCLFLLLCGALMGASLTADIMNLFVWFEVAALASYALTAFFLERAIAVEAAFKILVLTTIASFGIFIGVALVYSTTGGLDFGQIEHVLSGRSSSADLVALALLLCGFATKAGLVPFHGWLPDAHTAAPGPVSALFSGLMVNMGVVAIGRLTFEVFTPSEGHDTLGFLLVLGLVSALGGAVFALVQDDLKRLLAYDTISQMGVIVVGLATGSATGIAGAEYHLVDHALFKALLFLCAGSIVHMTGATHLSEMGGLARRYPYLAAAFTVGALSIAGLPPFNGFVSVGLIHDALRSSHQWVPLGILVLSQVVTVGALGKALWLAFFRREAGQPPAEVARDESLRPGMAVALGLLSLGCLVFGVWPQPLLSHVAAPAASVLLNPTGYAHAVLHSGGAVALHAVSFDYADPLGLAIAAGSLALGIPLAVLAARHHTTGVLERIRSIQTGSVNDYAGYLVAGLVVSAAVLAR